MKVKDITVNEIFDSRGDPTVEIELRADGNRSFSGAVPAGKSRGRDEATVLPMPAARKSAAYIKKSILGKRFTTQTGFDTALIELDGTENKDKLGANVMLGISIAAARAIAFENDKNVWQTLRSEFFRGIKDKLPMIFSNIINGGVHARTNLDIQEYLVVLTLRPDISEGIKNLVLLYREIGDALKNSRGLESIPVGDEAGYAVDFRNNFEPIEVLTELIRKSNRSKDFQIGLDAAASSFYNGKSYTFGGRDISGDELATVYHSWFQKNKLLMSVEDPFAEIDRTHFRMLKEAIGGWVVGDDLTVTRAERIKQASVEHLINAVIIKPNQIGTVTEACRAIETARENGLKVIISHRSGETEDPFIMHLAKASAADGVKIGAPNRERMTKFNELVRIYQKL